MIDYNGDITFEKVVPMPKVMKKRGNYLQIMTQVEIDNLWEEYHKSKTSGKLHHDLGYPDSIGITQEDNDKLMTKYGVNNWYDWSVKYWGCKWDASSDETWEGSEGYVSFSTAWNPPEAFIKSLSKKHPEELIAVEWEEEQGFGQVYIIKNAHIIEVKEEWYAPDWGEEEEVDGFIIRECLSDGGRADVNVPLFLKGKWYIDMEASHEFNSLGDATEYLKELDE